MQVGDLVTIAPARAGFYIITNLKAIVSGTELPDCVMLASLGGQNAGCSLPMGKRWVEIISENR